MICFPEKFHNFVAFPQFLASFYFLRCRRPIQAPRVGILRRLPPGKLRITRHAPGPKFIIFGIPSSVPLTLPDVLK